MPVTFCRFASLSAVACSPLSASFAASVVGWDKDFPEMTMAQLQNRRNEFWSAPHKHTQRVSKTARACLIEFTSSRHEIGCTR